MDSQNKDGRKAGEDRSSDLHLGDSTLQTQEEHAHDKELNPQKDDNITAVDIDLRETDAQKTFGSDRAGSSERKDNTVGGEQSGS